MNTTEALEAIAQHYNQQPRWLDENQIEIDNPKLTITIHLEPGDELEIDDKFFPWLDRQVEMGFNGVEYRSSYKNALGWTGWLAEMRFPPPTPEQRAEFLEIVARTIGWPVSDVENALSSRPK